jgi:hypothetical protein
MGVTGLFWLGLGSSVTIVILAGVWFAETKIKCAGLICDFDDEPHPYSSDSGRGNTKRREIV